MEKFGRTLLLLLFILLFIKGANMALKIAQPTIRQISVSLADAIENN